MSSSKRGSTASLRKAASQAALATANAASTTMAVVQRKKEVVLTKPKKGVGQITDEECLEMQKACGYGGPHVIPKIDKV